MVGGQMADMLAEGGGLGGVPGATPIDQVAWIHDRKTAALLTASLEVGAWAGGGSRVPDVLQALRSYGLAVGRAFQIVDDCLDRTGTAEELGKAPGQDQAADKLTYPAILGVPASIVEAERLAAEAAALAVEITGGDSESPELDAMTGVLQDVAFFAVHRTR